MNVQATAVAPGWLLPHISRGFYLLRPLYTHENLNKPPEQWSYDLDQPTASWLSLFWTIRLPAYSGQSWSLAVFPSMSTSPPSLSRDWRQRSVLAKVHSEEPWPGVDRATSWAICHFRWNSTYLLITNCLHNGGAWRSTVGIISCSGELFKRSAFVGIMSPVGKRIFGCTKSLQVRPISNPRSVPT